MIEVQDKIARLSPLANAQRRTMGSVPVVLPGLLPRSGASGTALYNEICSMVLIVLMPAAFWCGVLMAVRSCFGLDTSLSVLSCTGLLIAAFLLIIRASLAIDRSA